MAAYSLSSKAATDLDGIYEYTIPNFGLEQARASLSGLHERFKPPAEHPTHGRNAHDLAPGLRHFEYQSHIVYFLPGNKGVQIVRVLHQCMDVKSTCSRVE